jgi:death-on-curing protein
LQDLPNEELTFLSLDSVILLHRGGIEDHGGTFGVRDAGTLESAVMQPQLVHFYGGDIFDVAAAYAFHIAESQCFLDGNKRAAVLAALAFLRLNGKPTPTDSMDLYDYMIGIAEKRYSKADLAGYFRECATNKSSEG